MAIHRATIREVRRMREILIRRHTRTVRRIIASEPPLSSSEKSKAETQTLRRSIPNQPVR